MNTSATGPLAITRTFSSVTQSKYSGTVCRSWWTTSTVRPRVAQFPQDLDDRLLGDRVHALERLVHQVHRRVLHQCPGEEHPLLLPAGELADLPAGEVGHADPAERVECGLPLGAPGRRNQPSLP